MSNLPDTTKKRTTVWAYTPIGYKLAGSVPILIIVLKFLGVQPMAGWAWFWVLSPFWIMGALGILLALGMFLVFYLFDR